MSSAFVLRLDRGRLDWEAAIRAMLATGIPLFVLLAVGRLDLGMYASFASFTALYGRSEPYRRRAVTLSVAAAAFVLCITGGTLVQASGLPWWMLAPGFLLVVAMGTMTTSIMQWIPRGSVFFSFAYLGCGVRPLGDTPVAEAIGAAVLTAALSWAIGMSGWVLRRHGGMRERLRELAFTPERRIRSAFTIENGLLIATLAVAGSLAMVLALLLPEATHRYWAVVTVVAIFAGPAALVSFDRIGNRVVGTLIGVGVAAALYGTGQAQFMLVIIITLCTFVTELVIGQHYGWALASITPTAIGATNLGLTSEWEALFVDRARETLIGGAVCLAFVLLFRWWRARRGLAQID